MKIIEIDGSYGEGGGQILRTSLSLSCITGRSLSLSNIRRKRKRPGLMAQHLTCIQAVKEICNAEVQGDTQGSTELFFSPHRIDCGNFTFNIGTAGSTSLVFQTLLPVLLCARGPSHLTIRGGTHVPFSPPYNYIHEVFLPVLSKIGVDVRGSILKYGFYPEGGGEVSFAVNPVREIHPLQFTERGPLVSLHGVSAVADLPMNIAVRQSASMKERLRPLHADILVESVPSPGRGTFTLLKGIYKNTIAGFSSLGRRGKPAEKVGAETAEDFNTYHGTSSSLDPHLADQIVLYLALARGKSTFTTSCITKHLITNLWVIREFLDIEYTMEGERGSEGRISIMPE